MCVAEALLSQDGRADAYPMIAKVSEKMTRLRPSQTSSCGLTKGHFDTSPCVILKEG